MAKTRFHQVTGFDDRVMLFVGLPLVSLMVSLLLFNEQYVAGDWFVLRYCIPLSLVYSAAFWFSMRWAYIRVKLRYPAMRDFAKRMIWLGLAFLAVYVAVDIILDHLIETLLPEHQDGPGVLAEFVASLILSALVIVTYEVISFNIQLQATVAENAELERRNVESQLEGLRNQVNPHFLFNSLNTLVYLIPEDPEKAVRFVQQLSKVYRYVLESRDARVIPLSDELEYLHSYIFLLKERFGDNLQVRLDKLENNPDRFIVPLTLQMLFENAIKHNIISVEKPLTVEVFTENGHLVVRNNLQRKNQVMDSTGVGLENIRTRYRMLTEREVEVIVSREFFTVLLPIIDLRQAEDPALQEHAIKN